ncbi:MAG: phage tail tube protein [Agathobacter sp.]
MQKTGVYPVYENQFQVGAAADSATNIADMETFSAAFNNGIEKWNPMDQEGWERGLMTTKGITISISGKRNIGDDGNDFVAGKYMSNGRDAEGYFCWTFPDGSKLELENAIFDVKNVGSGDATNVGPLEFDVNSNGKPKYTPAV